MKYVTVLIFLLLISCNKAESKKEAEMDLTKPVTSIEIEQLSIDSISIRALQYKNGKYWYGSGNSKYGFYEPQTDQLLERAVDSLNQAHQFRSIAVLKDRTLILLAGSPGDLYSINHDTLKEELIFSHTHEGVFYDSMVFKDDQTGFIMGDATELNGSKCLEILKTTDGGESWKRISCDNLPAVTEGGGAFAASNSNIAVQVDHVWIATGGKVSRVWKSINAGESFTAYETPMAAGGIMTGIFAMDFYDKNRGVIIGGNWEDKSNNSKNLAVTTDGGRTWQLVSKGSGVGYCSDIQFIPDGKGEELLATGSEGIWFSPDFGESWIKLSNEGFYTAAMESSTTGVLAGNHRMVRFELKR
jgi:hypothetical protein